MTIKIDEGKLISGKEALIALVNGEEIEARHKQTGMGWSNAMALNLFSFKSSMFEFRLKPRTITINGIEVPAPFEPKEGDIFYYLNDDYPYGYMWLRKTQDHNFKFGAWRTEEEIKQVVAALRQVFGGSHDN